MSLDFLSMALCIAPQTPELAAGVAEVQRALDALRRAEARARDEL